MATATARETVTVEQLVALWHGDPDLDGDPDHHVNGYWHPELVIAVCELIRPVNDIVVRARFYPSRSDSEIPEYAVKLIRLGYDTWRRRRRSAT